LFYFYLAVVSDVAIKCLVNIFVTVAFICCCWTVSLEQPDNPLMWFWTYPLVVPLVAEEWWHFSIAGEHRAWNFAFQLSWKRVCVLIVFYQGSCKI